MCAVGVVCRTQSSRIIPSKTNKGDMGVCICVVSRGRILMHMDPGKINEVSSLRHHGDITKSHLRDIIVTSRFKDLLVVSKCS